MTRPIRCLHVVSAIGARFGGPSQVVGELCAALEQQGVECEIVTTDVGSEQVPAVFRNESVHVKMFRALGPARLRLSPPMLGYLWRAIARSDIVNIHGLWEIPLEGAGFLCRRLKVPYLVRPCGMLDAWCLDQKRRRKRLQAALLERRHLSRAAAVHCLNQAERAQVVAFGVTGRTIVVPNGIDAETYEHLPPPGNWRSKFPQIGDRPLVTFLSRLHFKKGLDILASAFRRVSSLRPDAVLVVAGGLDGPEANAIRRLFAALEANGKVFFPGFIGGAEKLALLRDSNMFVLPSRQEGHSVAITEALGAGLPVVITPACNFPEVADNACGVVVPGDPADLAAAILGLLDRPHDALEMGARGRQMVLREYTWTVAAARLLSFYRETSAGRVE